MDYLEPPYHFIHPHPNVPFVLPVARYEVGLSQRPITAPPYSIIKPTIRFHLPTPFPPDLLRFVTTTGSSETPPFSAEDLTAHPYLDFTTRRLLEHVVRLYREENDRLEKTGDQLLASARSLTPGRLEELVVAQGRLIDEWKRWLPGHPDALIRLRLRRLGTGIDTAYDVAVVGD